VLSVNAVSHTIELVLAVLLTWWCVKKPVEPKSVPLALAIGPLLGLMVGRFTILAAEVEPSGGDTLLCLCASFGACGGVIVGAWVSDAQATS
jgi:hypothetical protein